MSKDKEISPSASVVDALIAAWTEGEQEYSYAVKGIGTVRARRLTDASEMARFYERTDQLNEQLNGKGPCPVHLADYKGTHWGVINSCVYAHALLIEPKLSIADLLRLAKKAGTAFYALVNPLKETVEAEDAIVTNAAIESEGNASGAMSTSATDA